jgi:ABC-type lipoprotein export system ATPase subunit
MRRRRARCRSIHRMSLLWVLFPGWWRFSRQRRSVWRWKPSYPGPDFCGACLKRLLRRRLRGVKMSLLELDHVSKCDGSEPRRRVALRDVSLRLDVGERVAVYGGRRSGRSTLLRVAAGVETPDSGVVRFDGRVLTDHNGDLLGDGIGYCVTTFHRAEGRTVLDQMTVGQLARGVSPLLAQPRAYEALKRSGAEQCVALEPSDLDGAELTRVAIARVLAFQPRLLVIDEPTFGVDLLARDGILLLLQSLAEEGVTILMSTGETTGLSGADRALVLDDGELRGHLEPERASVISLRPTRRSASA